MPSIEVRPLRSHAEYLACVELQKAIWGHEFTECVPATILKVAQRVGGLTAGAFDGEGRLLGFVFGMTGIEDGRPVHWSDILAVREEARGHGVGRRLKEFQREVLRQRGVCVVYWTFDPLVARNAHLNLNRLGARVVEYVPDMYGDTRSELHSGLGTDRFVVAWRIAEESGAETRGGNAVPRPSEYDRAPVVNDAGAATSHAVEARSGDGSPLLRIAIPLDVHAVRVAAPAVAAEWRTSTRAAFLHLLGGGYHVAGFYRDDAAGRGFYVLSLRED
ncbi:MAG: GNAT family N-acetyltransferase [Gemmatimonadaceae bacterium]